MKINKLLLILGSILIAPQLQSMQHSIPTPLEEETPRLHINIPVEVGPQTRPRRREKKVRLWNAKKPIFLSILAKMYSSSMPASPTYNAPPDSAALPRFCSEGPPFYRTETPPPFGLASPSPGDSPSSPLFHPGSPPFCDPGSPPFCDPGAPPFCSLARRQ